jgi:flagellar biosynthesis/type III secretory pathway M-ring protein FliF/YscJ
MTDYNFILLIIKAVIGLIVVVGLTVYVLRPLVRNLSGMESRMTSTLPMNRYQVQEEEMEIPTSGPTDLSKREILKVALEDPLKTTQLVRNWLREKK